MSPCQERVISRPQVGVRLDSMAPSGLFQLCDSDSDFGGIIFQEAKILD